jgi:hypothetical protein
VSDQDGQGCQGDEEIVGLIEIVADIVKSESECGDGGGDADPASMTLIGSKAA